MVVATIGGFTAIMAGTIAITQTDLKRVLAYSTISQLGYMFLALGTGSLLGIVAGMFHLFTHAFFKALLFLGRGQRDARHGRRDRHAPLRRFAATHAHHLLDVSSSAAWRWQVCFRSPDFGAKTKFSAPCCIGRTEAGRLRHGNWYGVLYWVGVFTAGHDGVLHVPGVLPHVFRRRANSARSRASCP